MKALKIALNSERIQNITISEHFRELLEFQRAYRTNRRCQLFYKFDRILNEYQEISLKIFSKK